MIRRLLAAALLLSLPLAPPGAAEAAALPGAVRQVSVTGTGVSTYPTYDESVSRFAVRHGSATSGTVTVTATTSDPDGSVWLNGRPVTNGAPVEVSGLATGDEIAITIEDVDGRLQQSFVYLPTDFPQIDLAIDEPGQAPGFVALGLTSFLSGGYEAVVDRNGVPVHVRDQIGQDFKVSDIDPDHYTVARPVSDGWKISELDERLDEVRSFRLDGVPSSTDFHDAELLPGGGALLMGYDYADRDGVTYVDAVIQVVDAAGHATFTWNSKDHVDPAEAYVDGGIHDYAHINSLQMLDNGDVLASFRNLSQVMRIATQARPGVEVGDVVWRLGGELNDFTFVDDPDLGPCAQHLARLSPDGHLTIFDNGSEPMAGGSGLALQMGNMCADPENPDGAPIARPITRVTEYTLDEDTLTATLVADYRAPGRFSPFAGSNQPLSNGNMLIGWSLANDEEPPATQQPMVTEVDGAGNEIWAIQAENWFTYRAALLPFPDHIAPEVELTGIADGAVVDEGAEVVVDYGCSDRGGSSLAGCSAGPTPSGGLLDTNTPGPHVLTVSATDGAGNVTESAIHYRVRPQYQPDLWVRGLDGPWRGQDRYGSPTDQTVTFTMTKTGVVRGAQLVVENDGTLPDRVGVRGTASTRAWRARWFHGSTDVTRLVVSGSLRTPRLEPGQRYSLRLVVRRTRVAAAGARRTFTVTALSQGNASRSDQASVVVRTPRR